MMHPENYCPVCGCKLDADDKDQGRCGYCGEHLDEDI